MASPGDSSRNGNGESTTGGCLLALRRIVLLLWKNILFRRRHYIVTAFEILLPCVMAALLVYMRSSVASDLPPVEMVDGITKFPEWDEADLIKKSRELCTKCPILFTPNNNFTNQIVENFIIRTCDIIGECIDPTEIIKRGFASERELERAFIDYEMNLTDIQLSVVFDPNLSGPPHSTTGNKLAYTIRLAKESGFPPTSEMNSWFQPSGPDLDNYVAYLKAGFLSIQIRMENAIIKTLTGNDIKETIHVQAFPYPPYPNVSEFDQIINELLLPMFMVLGFVFIVPSVLRPIVAEKETGIKELLRMMGLPNWMHWLGWMLNSMFILIISITFVILIFFIEFNSTTGPFVNFGDPTVWWFVLLLFTFSLTSFCCFISAFFRKPSVATTVGLVLYFVTYFAISQTVDLNYQDYSLVEKMSCSLIPTAALHFAIKIMGAFEGNALGSQWSNFFEPGNSIDTLTVAHCCLMMFIDTILYLLLAIYFESIIPTKYGVRKPWYFIFLPSTYIQCGKKQISSENTAASFRAGPNSGKPGFENEPLGLRAGVIIQNLRKVFDNSKVAVDNISFKLYDGQITALLGHNGAGKTTTMSILTGMHAATSGTAIINGHDINKEMDLIRANLGLCPQHNMLFDILTVREHLIFFGRLKGLSSSEAQSEMKEMLVKLQLKEKKDVQSMSLSGGQKRKLSLGIALIGGTKTVILDEPTSGMDPEARRAIWDLLLKMRGERTILLTTHFMEEADILGDRIAIMADGKLQCCGTPMFLKEFYGTGYTLKMTISPQSPVNRILQVVQKYIPTASMKSQQAPNSSEVSISIPSKSETTAIFSQMFSELSELKENLKILTIGISLTTMDEVFVKAGQFSTESNGHNNTDANSNLKNPKKNFGSRPTYSRVIGLRLVMQQFWGLLLKRMIYTLKKYRVFIVQFILPVILMIVAISVGNDNLVSVNDNPPLKIELGSYKNAKTIFAATDTAKKIAQAYKTIVSRASSTRQIEDEIDIIDALVSVGETDLGSFRAHHIVSADFNDTSAKALFSTIPNHAAPLAINLISNAILQNLDTNYSIDLTVHPLKGIYDFDLEFDNLLIPILFGTLVPIGLAAVAACYLIFPVEERLCKAKQLQLMTGVSPILYWITSYLWDFCMMVILVAILVACLPIFESFEAFSANGGSGVVFLLLCMYGFAAISFSYLFSHFVATVAGGFTMVILLHLISGMILSIVVFQMEVGGNADNTTVKILRVIGTFFPTFLMSTGLMKYIKLSTGNRMCSITQPSILELICNPGIQIPGYLVESQGCCSNCAELTIIDQRVKCFELKPYITWDQKLGGLQDFEKIMPGIAWDLIYLGILGIVYFLLTLLVEYGIFRMIFGRLMKADKHAFQTMSNDEDVQTERNRVRALISSGRIREDAFLASDLSKSYGSLQAVSNLSFGVHHGECFGLLGVNGAGKTTTFRMLTGDEICSSGNAYTMMHTLLNTRSSFLSNIGYCPQFDGIVGVLSGRQMLEFFCRLRGIPKESVAQEADRWLTKLGLYESGDVQCNKYSGGMKRRLSAAMALVGDLPLILLDEPTSGVDPVARRQFWNVIQYVRDCGQAVILTSHSMEECEVLCSRLGIMVNGQFQCLGGVQHLRNKFAQGYSLLLKLKPLLPPNSPEINALNEDICKKFSPCELKDRHQNILKYQVYNTSMSWDILFKTMEDFKTYFAHIIEDYTVSETSLEEVFLSFARKQYTSRTANVSLFKKIITCQL